MLKVAPPKIVKADGRTAALTGREESAGCKFVQLFTIVLLSSDDSQIGMPHYRFVSEGIALQQCVAKEENMFDIVIIVVLIGLLIPAVQSIR